MEQFLTKTLKNILAKFSRNSAGTADAREVAQLGRAWRVSVLVGVSRSTSLGGVVEDEVARSNMCLLSIDLRKVEKTQLIRRDNAIDSCQ